MLRIDRTEWYTTHEAARILGVTERQIRRLAAEGRILARRLGRVWLLRGESLEAYESLRGYCNRYGTRGGRRRHTELWRTLL